MESINIYQGKKKRRLQATKVRAKRGIKAFDEHANECTNSQRPSKV
jgi:hypothetical protein